MSKDEVDGKTFLSFLMGFIVVVGIVSVFAKMIA